MMILKRIIANDDVEQYKDQYVKLIVVNKKDLYEFDKFVDRLLAVDAYDIKIIEDFSEWMRQMYLMIL